MQIARKIRLYPTKEQGELFWQFAGTSRWAWNESLSYRIARYEKDGSHTTIQQGIEHIQDLKHNDSGYEWVKLVPEAITKQSIKDLVQERHRRSCCGVRVSFADIHKSAPLQSAGGFLSVGD